ncbi:MFS multidrug transporter-like protein [Xylaria cubensis]|nr:MFS multidrug transporter-like protein [Xylaria cubensis]
MGNEEVLCIEDQRVESDAPTSDNEFHDTKEYLQGRRLWLVSASLGVMMFMVTFEIPVVATSIVAITDDLGGVDNRSWLLTSYLLGYVAIIVISSKLSDIYGRRPLYTSCIIIFLIASVACSAAQTTTQLIIFRAFQGLGGGGCYSLGTIITMDLVPAAQYTIATARLSICVSLGLLLGPVIGGAISANTTWRWIFIINVPVAIICFGLVFMGMPRDFPLQGQASHDQRQSGEVGAKSTLAKLDILGAILLLFAVLSLTSGFEEAGSLFPWNSAYVISLLVLSGVFWVLLLGWEYYVTSKDSVREPILPWRFVTQRFIGSILLSFAFLGGPFVISVYQLPQRFQLVNGLSGLDAGVRLIPFTLASPVGTGVAASVAGRLKIAPIWIILTGAVLQVIGFSLLGTLPLTLDLLPRTYGFEIIAGFGCGMNLALLFVIIPNVVDVRDKAVALGAASQFRMMGSAIAAAVANSVYNGYTRSRLAHLDISDTAASSITRDTVTSATIEQMTKLVYAGGFNQQMIVLAAFAAAQIPAALLLWKRPQLKA